MMISFILLILIIFFFIPFYTYRCDAIYLYHKWTWYGKEIQGEWTCMNGDNLQLHKTSKVTFKNKVYYFCSQHCFNNLVKKYMKVAIVKDALTGVSIYKSDALIGLKEQGKPKLVYFKNKKNLNQYYKQRDK